MKQILTLLNFLRCFRYNRFWGGQNHLVYIGDSRVRQLYTAARGQLHSLECINPDQS